MMMDGYNGFGVVWCGVVCNILSLGYGFRVAQCKDGCSCIAAHR
jgi:hypothetical protein